MSIKNTILTAGALVALVSSTSAFAQQKVIIGEPSWAGAKIIANLIKVVITDRLGGEADTTPSTNPVIFKAMDAGKGDIDVHPDVWLPNQKSLTDAYVKENKSVALSEGGYTGSSGFCVPKYTAEEQGVKSVYDLATPENAKLFDTDNDGKGEIWAGVSASAGTKIRQVKIREYGIDQFFTSTNEEEEIGFAKVGNAIRKKEAIVFPCYSPHYMFKLYDLAILEEPAYDPEKYKMVQPDQDPDWFAKSKVATADSQKIVHVAYSRSLEERAPQVAIFLSNIELDADTVSEWTREVVVENKEAEDVVRAWVEANKERVDGWLGL